MGKVARFLVVLVQIVVSIGGVAVGADPLSDGFNVEHGDDIARGQRAMALLTALFVSVGIIAGAAAYDMCVRQFLDLPLLFGLLLLAILAFFGIYLPLDRRISRHERDRAEAVKSPANPPG